VPASRRYLVRWADAAARDLEEIASFVARESPENAQRLLAKLEAAAASLELHPRRGRIVPELMFFGLRRWRELVVRPYRLVYRIGTRSVIVLAVFDGRRDLEDVLLDRLLRAP
jgi:plasmid stabilization system protein ParE